MSAKSSESLGVLGTLGLLSFPELLGLLWFCESFGFPGSFGRYASSKFPASENSASPGLLGLLRLSNPGVS